MDISSEFWTTLDHQEEVLYDTCFDVHTQSPHSFDNMKESIQALANVKKDHTYFSVQQDRSIHDQMIVGRLIADIECTLRITIDKAASKQTSVDHLGAYLADISLLARCAGALYALSEERQ